jgi:CheY-like chemotaxis protein
LIVALSGYGHDEHLKQTARAGFDCHVVKPVDPAALTGLLASRCPGKGPSSTPLS